MTAVVPPSQPPQPKDSPRRAGRRSPHPPWVQRRIIELRLQGLSRIRIARTLTEERIPTAGGGARWSPSSIDTALYSCYLADAARSMGIDPEQLRRPYQH
ncbi:recombinase family protein [Spirillospora sp. NPDC048911]|uniref:recombinase family protein n=1 Tax=Spirillospora sp. NPDC048911 TaxID=3364527 RepID=UPI0037224843